jgi:tRNA threonylcarbamoyladenosine biosynthesis protein TsaE
MTVEVSSETAMKALGEKLGALLKGGEIIELIGDVGAGKTTLVKGIARGLAIDEDIQSPSFTISRVYDARGGLTLAHYDFYRLHDAGIMANELHETLHDPKTITIVEWADIVGGVLPESRISIHITSPSEESRVLTMDAKTVAGRTLLKELA